MPLDYRSTPGNSYTDTVHVPTGGAHEVLGFDVKVEMTAGDLVRGWATVPAAAHPDSWINSV